MTEEQLAAWDRLVRRGHELRTAKVADIEHLRAVVAMNAFHAGEGQFKRHELKIRIEDLEEFDAILAVDNVLRALRSEIEAMSTE